MKRTPAAPDLIEQYMQDNRTEQCWVTVRDIRTHFNLDESAGPALSGFLQKIHQGPFFSCRYKVSRIEKFEDTVPPYRIIRRYYLEVRPACRRMRKTTDCKQIQTTG